MADGHDPVATELARLARTVENFPEDVAKTYVRRDVYIEVNARRDAEHGRIFDQLRDLREDLNAAIERLDREIHDIEDEAKADTKSLSNRITGWTRLILVSFVAPIVTAIVVGYVVVNSRP